MKLSKNPKRSQSKKQSNGWHHWNSNRGSFVCRQSSLCYRHWLITAKTTATATVVIEMESNESRDWRVAATTCHLLPKSTINQFGCAFMVTGPSGACIVIQCTVAIFSSFQFTAHFITWLICLFFFFTSLLIIFFIFFFIYSFFF